MQYNNLLWCPIDVPKFPYSNFDIPTSSTRWAYWDFKKITTRSENPYDISEINSYIYEEYPNLIDWINLFPYKSIRNIKFNTQINTCEPHIDFNIKKLKDKNSKQLFYNNNINEPSGYRALLSGSKTNKQYIMYNDEKIYTTIPEDTDTFVHNNTSLMHGVDDEPGRKLLYMHFEIDPNQHQKLLQISLEKYKDYAIY